MRVYITKVGDKDRRLGIMFIRRYGDWAYLDVCVWQWCVMINVWRVPWRRV